MVLWQRFVLTSEWAFKLHFLRSELVWIPAFGQSGDEECRCLYIEDDDRGGGLVLTDTGEVKGDKEKKHFDIETMMDETRNTVWIALVWS